MFAFRELHNQSEEESTQARLMKTRGDLSKTAYSFRASLPAPRPKSRGLGMDVVRSDTLAELDGNNALLLVADVDNDPCQSTPVAAWNWRENRQAYRSLQEQHASLAIKPGDKICSVNGMHGDETAMAELLTAAADVDSPKAVNLTLERSRSDVLGPLSSPLLPRPPTSGARSSRFAIEAVAIGTFNKARRNSNPDGQNPQARTQSKAWETTESSRRNSEPDASSCSPPQWKSMLSAAPVHTRGRCKRMEDEASTRSPSVSLSGRCSSASSASTCEQGPPLVIKSTDTRQALARVGLSTLRR